MTSFKALPDEILVKIFASLEDNDATKIRLERVSSRFYNCLRESWNYSSCCLDFTDFSSLSHSAAFMVRVPQISHLRIYNGCPDELKAKQLQQLFQNTSKLRVSKLKYIGYSMGSCHSNAYLIVWCLSNFGSILESLSISCKHIRCCYDNISCETLHSLMELLPMCTNLQQLKLARLKHYGFADPKISEVLQELNLRSLSVSGVADGFGQNDLIELLNSKPSVEILKIARRIKGEDDHFAEFCQSLNEPAARMIKVLKVESLCNWESIKLVGRIHEFLPNLSNLTIWIDWEFREHFTREEQDAGNMMKIIEEFILNGARKDFDVSMMLYIVKRRKTEFHYGAQLLELIDQKQNIAIYKGNTRSWRKKLIKDNVTVCVDAEIHHHPQIAFKSYC